MCGLIATQGGMMMSGLKQIPGSMSGFMALSQPQSVLELLIPLKAERIGLYRVGLALH